MAAVGKFVLWGKENLCLIRPQGDTLAMETLFFAEDVRSKKEIEEAVEATEVKKAELALAAQVIDSLVGEWNPADFENDYRRELQTMLDAKLAGQEIKRPEPAPDAPVIDLMEALRQSVVDVQQRRGGAKASEKTKAASSGGSRRKTPARKASSARLRQSSERFELRLEEVPIDLALVDRHALLHAEPDHLLPIDVELFRQFFGREVIRHPACSFLGHEKTRRRRALRRVSRYPFLST